MWNPYGGCTIYIPTAVNKSSAFPSSSPEFACFNDSHSDQNAIESQMLTCVSMMTIIFLYLLTLCPFEKCLSIYIAWIIFTLLVAWISVSHTCHVEYSTASTCLPIIHSSSLLLTFSTSLCPGG